VAFCTIILNRESLFDFCAMKMVFLEIGRYVRSASRKEEGLMRDRGLGQEEIKELHKHVECFIWDLGFQEMGIRDIRRTHAIKQGQSKHTLGGPPGQSSDFQVAHKGSTLC
jgi:hypothetical protein